MMQVCINRAPIRRQQNRVSTDFVGHEEVLEESRLPLYADPVIEKADLTIPFQNAKV